MHLFHQSVRSSVQLTGKLQKKTTIDRELYFYLRADNGQTIATSQKYTSALSREQAIERIQKVAPAAPV
ncbi:YegP family protein [Flavobacterium sp. FlaQc-48]|uniref:YegP family protein n=1 Tax=Flavobacterium sp. FlaQc-48 TaxID=3374181 RepID=UPI00375824E0